MGHIRLSTLGIAQGVSRMSDAHVRVHANIHIHIYKYIYIHTFFHICINTCQCGYTDLHSSTIRVRSRTQPLRLLNTSQNPSPNARTTDLRLKSLEGLVCEVKLEAFQRPVRRSWGLCTPAVWNKVAVFERNQQSHPSPRAPLSNYSSIY